MSALMNPLVGVTLRILPVLQTESSSIALPWWVFLVVIAVALLLLLVILARQQAPGAPIPSPEEQAEALRLEFTKGRFRAPRPVEIQTDESEMSVKEEPKPDNLTRIEGIGPKIASILQKSGISTFEQLADMDLDQLDKLLDDENLHFTNESSWPEQARLAADGKWDELAELQKDLKGSRSGSAET